MARSNTEWTKEFPTDPGWYWVWVADDPHGCPLIEDVIEDETEDSTGDLLIYEQVDDPRWVPVQESWYADYDTYWLGPIPRPEPPKGVER